MMNSGQSSQLSQSSQPGRWSVTHRITSYNVCYTKLLRGQPELGEGVEEHLGGGAVGVVDGGVRKVVVAE